MELSSSWNLSEMVFHIFSNVWYASSHLTAFWESVNSPVRKKRLQQMQKYMKIGQSLYVYVVRKFWASLIYSPKRIVVLNYTIPIVTKKWNW